MCQAERVKIPQGDTISVNVEKQDDRIYDIHLTGLTAEEMRAALHSLADALGVKPVGNRHKYVGA